MFLSVLVSCKKEQTPQPEIVLSTPEGTSTTEFSGEVLQQEIITFEGNITTFERALRAYRGKPILIDIWTSWCSDCIKGMPKVHKLQEEFDLVYMFLSFDRSEDSWREGVKRYKTIGENFLIPESSRKQLFKKALEIDWIPRYILVDHTGKIAHFRAVEADDPKLIEKIKELIK